MPTERIVMRRVREMLRLSRDAGLGLRAVAAWADVAPSTVGEMLRRFEASGLVWPLPLELTDAELEERLYGVAAGRGSTAWPQAGRAIGAGPSRTGRR